MMFAKRIKLDILTNTISRLSDGENRTICHFFCVLLNQKLKENALAARIGVSLRPGRFKIHQRQLKYLRTIAA